MTHNRCNALAALAAAWLGLACEQRSGAAAAPRPSQDLEAVLCAGALPKADPKSAAWSAAPEHVETMLLQDQAEPKLLQGGVELVRARALHDGNWLAVRLEWEDPTEDAIATSATFTDGAAVQFPVAGGGAVPDAAMGQPGRPVRIHQWTEARQAALADGYDPVRAAFPRTISDLYPFEAAPEASRAAMELSYAPARAVKNPVATPRKEAPTVDLVCEGFGSLKAAPDQVSVGRGVRDGRKWLVVIARPLDAGANEALRPGTRTYAALAVWDGAQANVGARKRRSGWIPLSIAPTK